MSRPEVPRWQVAALFVVIVATSAGVFVYSAVHPPAPYCATDPGAAVCPPANENITYASEDVEFQFNTSGPPVVSNSTFEGVEFHLWPGSLSPTNEYLSGVADEPSGVNIEFIVYEYRSWFSEDGAFGVAWFGGTNDTVGAQLSVADPPLVYALQNLTPTWAGAGSSSPVTVDLQGVVFAFHTWSAVETSSVNAAATLANGTRVALSLVQGAPVYVACNGGNGVIHTPTANASCLEDANANLGVGMVWYTGSGAHGPLNIVTLMVRVG